MAYRFTLLCLLFFSFFGIHAQNQIDVISLDSCYTMTNIERGGFRRKIHKGPFTEEYKCKIFLSHVYFDSAEFNSPSTEYGAVDFLRSRFTDRAYFRNTKFNAAAFFRYATFDSLTVFSDTYFSKFLDFREIVCNSPFVIQMSTLETRFALFSGAEFNAGSGFDNNKFKGKVDFSYSKFDSITFFNVSKFNTIVDFSGANFKTVHFDDVNFNGYTYFQKTEFNDSVYFTNTVFGGDVSFEETKFNASACFTGARFKGDVYLRNTRLPDTLVFNYVKDIYKTIDLSFASVDSITQVCYIDLTESDISKIKLQYFWFQLIFSDSLGFEKKSSIYEQLLGLPDITGCKVKNQQVVILL